ncbi:MAG: 2-phosphosulfolactate phosphatase [Pseudomonadota bacterium]
MLSSADIEIGSFDAPAREATGTVVIIDVFRAFTTAAIAFRNGAEQILMVDDVDRALALREGGRGTRCMGERAGVAPGGFDFGNSPVEIADVRFDRETLIQTTTNGTRGILAASGSQRIYAGSFAVASATAQAIAREPILPVTLVAMGDRGVLRTDEDELCALWLRALLCGRSPDPAALAGLVRSMADLRDTRKLSAPDVAACLIPDQVDFAIRVRRQGDICIAAPEPV